MLQTVSQPVLLGYCDDCNIDSRSSGYSYIITPQNIFPQLRTFPSFPPLESFSLLPILIKLYHHYLSKSLYETHRELSSHPSNSSPAPPQTNNYPPPKEYSLSILSLENSQDRLLADDVSRKIHHSISPDFTSALPNKRKPLHQPPHYVNN